MFKHCKINSMLIKSNETYLMHPTAQICFKQEHPTPTKNKKKGKTTFWRCTMSKLTTVSHVICKKIMVKNFRLFIKLQDVTFLSCSKVYNILLSLWLRRKRTLTFQFIKVHCKNIPNFVFKDDLRKNTIFYVCLFDDVRSTLLRNGTTKIQFDQCFL